MKIGHYSRNISEKIARVMDQHFFKKSQTKIHCVGFLKIIQRENKFVFS